MLNHELLGFYHGWVCKLDQCSELGPIVTHVKDTVRGLEHGGVQARDRNFIHSEVGLKAATNEEALVFGEVDYVDHLRGRLGHRLPDKVVFVLWRRVIHNHFDCGARGSERLYFGRVFHFAQFALEAWPEVSRDELVL